MSDKEQKVKETMDFLSKLKGEKVPDEIDIQGFLQSLDNFKNKENFIAHLRKKDDSQSRLAYLNLIEPTFKKPDVFLRNSEKKSYIKAFENKKDKSLFELLITRENDRLLITSIQTNKLKYLENEIRNADLIQTFTSRAGKNEITSLNEPTRDIIPQNKDNTKQKSPFFSKMKNTLHKVKEGLNRGKEKINNDESYLDNENLKNLNKDTKDESLKVNENKQDENLNDTNNTNQDSNTQNLNKTLRKRK